MKKENTTANVRNEATEAMVQEAAVNCIDKWAERIAGAKTPVNLKVSVSVVGITTTTRIMIMMIVSVRSRVMVLLNTILLREYSCPFLAPKSWSMFSIWSLKMELKRVSTIRPLTAIWARPSC